MKIPWLKVIRDVVMISLLTSLGGLIIHIAGIQETQTRIFLAAANIFFGVVGFTLSGCLARVQRFKHLFSVAIGLWIASLANLFMGAPFISWLLGIVPILLMMALGGALSFVFVREPQTEPDTDTSTLREEH